MKQTKKPKIIKASNCKCVKCGKKAVAFWPCIDPDIKSHPYCRKCLSEIQLEYLEKTFEFDK